MNAPYARPHYFGMGIDAYDNFTSDRIALGYASPTHGACVREMTVQNVVVGKPTDTSFPILKQTGVERSGDRTVVRLGAASLPKRGWC